MKHEGKSKSRKGSSVPTKSIKKGHKKRDAEESYRRRLKGHFLEDEAASSQGSDDGQYNHVKAKEADYYKEEQLK